MQQIKSFGILQTSKLVAVLYFAFAAVIVAPLLFFILNTRGSFGFLLVLVPFMYAVIAFLMSALVCWIYNLLAARIGGIEIELEPKLGLQADNQPIRREVDMQQIKSFGILQTSKFVAILYFTIAAVIAIIAAPILLLAGMATGNSGAKLGFVEVVVLLALPFFYGVFALLGTALICWVYNLLAPRVGGIAIELEPKVASPPSTGTQF